MKTTRRAPLKSHCPACGHLLATPRGRRLCRLRASQHALCTRPVRPPSGLLKAHRAVLAALLNVTLGVACLLLLHVSLAQLLWPWYNGLLVLSAWVFQGVIFYHGLAQEGGSRS